jgi:hypothetical protein
MRHCHQVHVRAQALFRIPGIRNRQHPAFRPLTVIAPLTKAAQLLRLAQGPRQ